MILLYSFNIWLGIIPKIYYFDYWTEEYFSRMSRHSSPIYKILMSYSKIHFISKLNMKLKYSENNSYHVNFYQFILWTKCKYLFEFSISFFTHPAQIFRLFNVLFGLFWFLKCIIPIVCLTLSNSYFFSNFEKKNLLLCW